jgi:2,3-dihydroxybenzoate decarboxylase
MRLIALEEAFWYDKLATEGSPTSRVPVNKAVAADWRQRLADPNAVPSDDWNVVGGYPELDTATWSWAARTGGHAMRLIFGGVFDRFPGARIILGHMGEFLPFQLSRFDARYAYLDLRQPLGKLPSEYFGTNIAITTTGVFSHAALIAAIQAVGIDNVMFSIDYPFETTGKAVDFISTAPLAPADKEKVAHANAERILRL